MDYINKGELIVLNTNDVWAIIAICVTIGVIFTNYFDNKYGRYKKRKDDEDENIW